MPTLRDDPRPLSPEDALPPVEPPSARFVVQLFVIPAVIVGIIVAVWLLFHWLAQMGNDPRQYLRNLDRNSEARWQAASNLADALRSDRDGRLKADAELAGELAAILSAELAAGKMDSSSVTLRVFLCKALGEFHVDAGLPVLIQTVATQRQPEEATVQRAAIESLAVLAANLQQHQVGFAAGSVSAPLIEASRSEDPLTRSAAAFALGVVGDAPARERLALMVDDAYADARYNAATGLARHGDPRAVDTLLEMLDPEQTAATSLEREEARAFKQALVLVNAMRASVQLAKQMPERDHEQLRPLRDAVARLAKSAAVPGEVQNHARLALKELPTTP